MPLFRLYSLYDYPFLHVHMCIFHKHSTHLRNKFECNDTNRYDMIVQKHTCVI